ncbi:MAG: tetratricopeptide repeat protein [Promethearchaeota archaeon]
MSLPELNELTRAEQLFDDGKLEKALEILNDETQYQGLNPQQKSYFQNLKGFVLTYLNHSEEVIKLGEHIFNEGQKLNEHLQSFDGLYFNIVGLSIYEKYDEAKRIIEKAESEFKLLSNLSKKVMIQRKARLNLLKAFIHYNEGNLDLAERYLEWTFNLQKELGTSFEIVWANAILGQIMLLGKRRTNFAMEYFQKALSLAKEIKFNHYWLGMCYGFIAITYQTTGEIDKSLEHYFKALKVTKGFKSSQWTAALYNNIGNTYLEMGEYDLALEYLEKNLNIKEIQPSFYRAGIGGCLDSLIYVALEKGDIKLAQKYFQHLEIIHNQTSDSQLDFIYKYNKALMLKRSSRIRDKVKAEELFKQALETETRDFVLILNTYIQICDLLLVEFRMNNNSEVLDEINENVAQILNIAETTHSYRFFCEAYILKAKIALLNFDIKEARRYLTQAQQLAESYNLKRLAMKISYEHDELIKQKIMWEKLKESNASLTERLNLAGLNEQMENMIKKRIVVPELSDEEPILLLILSEGGTPLFSHSFIGEKSYESHLFGGFLTTIDYFIREMFSEGLDRAIFGEYTLHMKSIPPFFISYIFKGDSYFALQKVDYFKDKIKKEEKIWQNLLKSFQINQTVKLEDLPLLETLISEIFVPKSMVSL